MQPRRRQPSRRHRRMGRPGASTFHRYTSPGNSVGGSLKGCSLERGNLEGGNLEEEPAGVKSSSLHFPKELPGRPLPRMQPPRREPRRTKPRRAQPRSKQLRRRNPRTGSQGVHFESLGHPSKDTTSKEATSKKEAMEDARQLRRRHRRWRAPGRLSGLWGVPNFNAQVTGAARDLRAATLKPPETLELQL
jgi:hypothetical protein